VTASRPVPAGPPPPGARGLPPRRASLTLRIVAGVLALLAVVLTAFTLTTLALSGRALDNQLEQGVQQTWERSVSYLLRGEDPEEADDFADDDPVEARGQPAGMLALVMDGGTVEQAGRLDADGEATGLSARDIATLTALADGAEDVEEEPVVEPLALEAGPYLVQAEWVGPAGVLVAGLPTSAVDKTKATLAEVQVLGSLAALMLAGLLGWWWIRRSLRPLNELSLAAGRVAEVPMGSGKVSLARYRVRGELARPGDEVGAVGQAMNRMIDSVDEAFGQRNRSEQRLRTFVADASHELRTPLAAVRGYTEMIGMTESLSEQGHDSLARVLHQADRMGSLVEDLLLLARLDAGPEVSGMELDLGEVVVDAVMDATAAGREHTWTVEVPEQPVPVFGDRQQLAQMVGNLLSNARKHTPAGTRVAVRLEPAADVGTPPRDGAVQPEKATVRLGVEDDGPGISPDLLPGLFDRFVRGDSARTTTEGSTGLGLSIVRSVAKAHGGDATVESAPGRTLFTVLLPGA
jgi:two-component system, OmpR family, sensor kinase